MEKRKHVMPGGPFQKREYREVTEGIGSHIHVEVVAEEITFLVGVPSPVTVGLGVMTFAVTGRTAFLLTIADALLRCCAAVRTGVPSPARARCRGLTSPCGWTGPGTAADKAGK